MVCTLGGGNFVHSQLEFENYDSGRPACKKISPLRGDFLSSKAAYEIESRFVFIFLIGTIVTQFEVHFILNQAHPEQ
jgi:hypothetical protein